MTASDEARALFVEAGARHEARDIAGSVELLRQALAIDPNYVEALEQLGTVLVTRRGRYRDGLALLERAAGVRDDDPGIWYTLGWCYEFAAHEVARRPSGDDIDVRALYERAGDGFRRCLALQPGGKLQGDAEDLLDHVENELRAL